MGGYDDSEINGAGKDEQHGEDGADLPRQLNRLRLMPFRPKEIEEEGSTEDGGYKHSGEDVVRKGSDNVIVPDVCIRISPLDVLLLVLRVTVSVIYCIYSSCRRVPGSLRVYQFRVTLTQHRRSWLPGTRQTSSDVSGTGCSTCWSS